MGYKMLATIDFWKNLIKEALLEQAEHNYIDFKAMLSSKTERLKEHVNAFGNYEMGGCLVLGVDEFKIIGAGNEMDELTQKVTHLAQNCQDPPLNVTTFTLHVDEKSLLCLYIHPSVLKPVFIKGRSPLAGQACFKRTGSSTVAMSPQEIRGFIGKSNHVFYDESPLPDAKLEQLNHKQLKELLPQLNDTELTTEPNASILLDNKITAGLPQEPKVSVAGWMVFAKKPQELREFRNAYIEFQLFRSNTRETQLQKNEIKGSLPEQIRDAVDMIMRHVWSIPKIQGVIREDVPAYSEEALREVITNSVVHRDYQKMHVPVKVAVFTDRIEVENPGGLMPGLTPLNFIHKREWRNPLIAELMKKFGFGEMDGQGIDRIYAATRALKVPAPVFIDSENSFKVILSAPKAFDKFTPEEKRLSILIVLITDGTIDNKTVRNVFDINHDRASTLIKLMVSENRIEAISKSKRFAKYQLTKQYRKKIFDT